MSGGGDCVFMCSSCTASSLAQQTTSTINGRRRFVQYTKSGNIYDLEKRTAAPGEKGVPHLQNTSLAGLYHPPL